MNLRYLWRSLSLVFVLWFALFPTLCFASETVTTASAISDDGIMLFTATDDDVANGLVNMRFDLKSYDGNKTIGQSPYYSFESPFTVNYQFTDSSFSDINNFLASSYRQNFHLYCTFNMVDNSTLISADDNFHVSLTNIWHEMIFNYKYSWSVVNVGGGSGFGSQSYLLSPDDIRYVIVQYFDGTNWHSETFWKSQNPELFLTNGDKFGFEADLIAPSFDSTYFYLIFGFNQAAYNFTEPDYTKDHYAATYAGTSSIEFNTGVSDGVFKITTPDESTGLLKGVIEWLKSIRDGITNVGNGITNVKNAVSNVFTAITELPSKIWTVFENGIKSLLVPSETDITVMKDKWDTLLSDRFGVVYESGALLIDIANSVQESSTRETITFPTVSYNFSGTDFTFGGYEVDVIPNGFEFLADILKGVIDIVCTLAFINAMRRKYDELMMR